MATIVIVGAGAMGTAFAVPAAENGHSIKLVGTHLDEDWIKSIRDTGVHPRLNVTLPGNIQPFSYTELPEALNNTVDLIVLGVSSPGISWAIKHLEPLLNRPIPIVLLTKGLSVYSGTIVTLPTLVQEQLKQCTGYDLTVGAVGGPCIAAELASGRDSSVIISTTAPSFTDQLQNLLSTSYYHIRKSEDLTGLELCAALKNFYTLAIGAAKGKLKKEGTPQNGAGMFNIASGLFTQALQEMEYLCRSFGGSPETVIGLAGAGDLYVTCMAGRNGRMGALLGQGISYQQAKSDHMPDDTVEGADLALTIGPALRRMMARGVLDPLSLPLALAVLQAVCDDATLTLPWQRFYR